MHPRWAADYFMHEKFELPQLKDYVKEGSNISVSVGDYFSTMLDQSMNWQDAADVRKKWGKQFCLKGIMSVADAKRAVDIGATAIMVSNHGGRQLDALASAGQPGVERALGNLRAEIERDMKLMGCRTPDQLSRDNLRFR
jgi:L-lactate dehydrogenase (cytochrome)